MADIHVVVIENGHGCKIVPPVTIIARGDTVYIRNLCGGDLELHFPDGSDIWDSSSTMPDVILNTKENSGIVANNAKRGYFEFSCYCRVTRPHHAEGNSQPAFIVR